MLDYQRRVLQEKEDLDEKVKNLQNFIESPEKINNVSIYEKDDLKNQLLVMKHYQSILQTRINRILK